jgi:hypothetical protein
MHPHKASGINAGL